MATTGYDSTNGSVFICPLGAYKASLGAFPCSTCGTGLLTNATGRTSYSDCCEWRGLGAQRMRAQGCVHWGTACTHWAGWQL